MAARKSINLLPTVFRTDVNDKFLTATLDQLISEPSLKNLYGYVGRKFAPTYVQADSYITEDSADRQNYQLEPATIIKDLDGNTTFFASYIDFLDKIKYYGGFVNDHSRLFSGEYYSFDPKISYDKFVNFGQYYWLPNGPASVQVNTSGVELIKTFIVTRNEDKNSYDFSSLGVTNNTLILARGGTYTFTVNQSSRFYIQSELGIDGLLNVSPTISSRDVLGVTNNGATNGNVIFNVPQKNAQDRYLAMTLVASVDYAVPLAFSNIQNRLLGDFVTDYPQYASLTESLDGKTVIFVDQNLLTNFGEEAWTVAGEEDGVSITYDRNSVVPDALRYGVWKIQLITTGSDYLINAYPFTAVAIDQKVYIRYGVENANQEFYKEFTGFFERMPLITATANSLVIQDSLRSDIYTKIKIVDPSGFSIDVEDDILGELNYTSPNGVEFTSGLKIQFDTDVTSAAYQGNIYIVENVGDSIRLVDTELLVKPESYNDELATNYPVQQIVLSLATNAVIPGGTVFTVGSFAIETNMETALGAIKITTLNSGNTITKGMTVTGNGITSGTTVYDAFAETVFPDYITIKRDALDLNAWSRNNCWYHVDVIKAAAEYNDDVLILDQRLRAQRPIVQFEGDLQLFNHGRIGKRYIDILDTNITDAFNQLEGQLVDDGGAITYNTAVSPAQVFYDGVLVGTANTVNFIGDGAFGVTLFDGMRVLFAEDEDPLVRDKIYVLNLVQFEVDTLGRPEGAKHIKLTIADDGDAEEWDSVVVRFGQRKGSAWWYDGSQWTQSQQKTGLQQDPLFDVYDSDDRSLSDTDYYPRSNFDGTKLFGYQRNTSGSDDAVLGFPLSYRSFQSQGDILFSNYFNTDTFTYVVDQETITENISIGFLQSISNRTTTVAKNTWLTVSESSRQYQLLTFGYDGSNNPFALGITPNTQDVNSTSDNIPYVKVYKNKEYLTPDKWSLAITSQWAANTFFAANTIVSYSGEGYRVKSNITTSSTFVTSDYARYSANNRLRVSTTLTTLAVGDIIDVEVYSSQISTTGYYQIPLNLDLNAQNTDIQDLTLGQIRNHLVALSRNSFNLNGDVLGPCNLRDIEIKSQGGTILQHSAPLPYAQLFLLDQQANFIDSVKLAQREYTKFKNKFLELAASLPGIDPTDPVASVDLIITQINLNKTPTMSWFYSDMVPYGTLKNTITYTVFDPFVLSYEITTVFSSVTLTNTAVLVYLNNVQLILGIDYTFDTLRPAITINDTEITLAVDNVITIVEYTNTDGSYIPETPSKLGTYPKFKPEIVADDTYRSTINVIRGHDGSITPAFDDYRDNFLLELEKRIYNNIKLPDSGTYQDIFSVLPGKFRDNGYSYTELWNILSKNFLTWVGNNRIADFSENNIFQSSEQFTWNYSRFTDRLDSESMVGSWRAVYLYFYDTIYPHTRPWEMLGFSTRPNWWEDFYGPGPYTGGNKLLWDDLEAGRIRDGERATENTGYGVGIDPKYRRPRLSQVIPVDDNGYLLSPAQVIAKVAVGKNAATAWAVGQLGPVEWAWRTSSEYPYAVQQAVALAKPGLYFGQFIDTYRIQYNSVLGQYLTDGNHHVRQTDITYNGDNSSGTVIRSAGYLNWIADYLRNLGINPSTKITNMLQNYNVKLAYKMAGYSDKKYLQILAEQSSPTSTNASIILPEENYDVVLYKSTPVDTVTYSAVIVEKTTNGFTVRGYDLNSPYFTIIPSVVNNNGFKITVLNSSGTVFNDYRKIKLTVPYGYEFKTTQQIVDFLISYERYLVAQGFTFNDRDGDLGETRNFKLSVKEFLFWSQQGWKTGTLLVMSPVTNSISLVTVGNIVDEVSDSQHGSKIVDQNFNLIKKTGYQVLRNASGFKVTLQDDNVLALVKLDLVQFEHVLTFDNTTVFNDVIYKPELGNRQYRLKLIGQKTDLWDGSLYAPGFIYNNKTVQPWVAGKDYLKGELVEFKDQYYVALNNVAASTEFLYAFWKQLSSSEIQTGLLNNFSTLAVGSKSFYDSYGTLRDNDQLAYSHGLIGFKPRQYLADLGVSDTTQIEFYKGYIRQKGSTNAVDALTKARFNNLSGNISLYEEWAVRIGEYGALDSNPYIEIALDEQTFSVNPAVAEFVDVGDSNLGDGLTVFNKSQLYKSTDGFDGNIALNRDNYSDYDNDVLTAGYVHLEDVSTTIYDIANYVELNDQLTDIGAGYTIWCAKDFSGKWNVYRVSETNNYAINLSNALDGFITWTMLTPHGLVQNDIFLIRGFDNNFNGFYQVYTVLDLNRVTVRYQGLAENLDDLNTLTGNGILFVLNSLRFTYMEDSRVYGLTNPLNRWRVGEKIWIDEDAATNTIQGQPYDTPSGGWKVYEKTEPWTYDQTLTKSSSEYTANDGFGTSVKLSYDGLLALIGSPYANSSPYYSDRSQSTEEPTGRVNTFDKNYVNQFVNGFTLKPEAGNALVINREFGYSVDQATNKIAISAPASAANLGGVLYSNIGLVYVYGKSEGTTSLDRPQIIWSGNAVSGAGDRFGQSISFDENGTWLYIGAPGNDRVYVYGLNKYVSTQQQIISVNNRNTIRLNANLSIPDNSLISNPTTGATARIISAANVMLGAAYAANLIVSTLTGFTGGNASANVYINNVDSGLYANLLFTVSNTSTITTNFTPEVNRITTLVVHAANSYSAGTTISFSASPIGGATAAATINFVAPTAGLTGNGNVASLTITHSGSMFDTAPTVTFTKPANVVVDGFTQIAGNVFKFTSNVTSGIYAGMVANVFFTTLHLGNPTKVVSVNTTTGNITMSMANSAAITSPISFGDVGLNGNITAVLGGDAESLTVTNSDRVFIPYLDYTVSGNILTFTGNLQQDVYTVKQQPYYVLSNTIQGPSGSDFGYSMDSSLDGAQLGVGAPSANVFVGNTWIQGAGAVYVYDRVIEAFNTTGNLDYTTTGTIDTVHRVTIDNIEVTNYTIPSGIGSHTIRFINPPVLGKTVYIETNQFNLLEQLIGVDSLEGGTDAIQANAAFGTDLTICSNNCAIYVGAPYYVVETNPPLVLANAGTTYNTGAVWKFHNRGRLYGTNNGYTVNPILTPGDTLRLDNFEITVSARMMPTTFDANTASTISGIPLIYVSANILALSSNIVANVGQVISQNLGSGYYANVVVLANTSPTANTVVGSQFITVGGNINLSGHMTANVFNYGPGDVVTIYANTSAGYSGTVSSAYPMASLDSLIKDINDANLLGITAVNENNTLRLNSNKTVAKNLLRVLTGTNSSGSDGVYAALDMKIFAFMQIIINPYNTPGEYFGNKVVLAQNASMLVIGSEKGTTRSYARFDVVTTSNVAIATTTLDVDSTRLFDSVSGSGSVYIYELYDDPRNEVEAPGRYSFAQQLKVLSLDADDPNDELNTGDRFGAAIDIIGSYIIASAPGDDTTVTDAGSIYIFANPAMTRGWNLIRYQQDKVDVDSVNRIFLYSNQTNTILTNLEFIDPAKGKVPGLADQEITYKTEYDPAVYNRGTNANSNYYWNTEQVNQVWWNLSQVRFIDYEQGSLIYRTINWGRLFPGSIIEVCEWVESSVLPSQYVQAGFDGRPKYADNSQYVEIVRVDPNTNIIGSTYYFWVTNKTSLTGNDPTRTLPIQSVADYISDPKGQGIAYAAIIKKDAVILYNVGNYLSAQNTILHLDYDMLKNTNVIHSEYELIQKSNPVSLIPEKISSKMIDSLSGVDILGRVVPDPRLSLADQYGISVRPRQSMFNDRLRAMSDLIEYVNDVLITKPIARQYDLTTLSAEEERPSLKLSEYDLAIATEVDLDYIDTASLSTGYRVLVEQNTEQDNLWTLHELQSDDTWDIVRVQSYKSSLYWEYIDWYAEGFSSDEVIEYVVETLPDAFKLPVAVGDEVLVKVNNSTGGGFNLLTVLGDGSFSVVGIENGTIQLKTSLSNFADNGIGLGNQGFDSSRFDQSPNIEIRYILEGLKNDIFINELQGTYNDLFFVMMNYLLSEQKYVDWLFKTSFVSVTHNLRALTQPANYIKDNITYYENYINEVKPYITKIREYLTNYDGDDNFEGTVTDFDLAPYYDPDTEIFRSPDGAFVEKDQQLWATGYLTSNRGLVNQDYTQWYQNRNFYVDEIIITNPGSGYVEEPTITITGGGANVQATATAEIDGDTGTITSITVVTPGNGYYLTPTVTINGSADTEATAYAVLRNNQLRTFDTTLKFDRISYGTTVDQWAANTFFSANTIVSYNGQGYRVISNITTSSTFVTSDYTKYSANNFSNANDRIMAYYDPTNTMPAKDLNQLIPGIEYPGVKVQGLDFNQQPGFSGEIRANITFNTAISTAVGDVIRQPEADIILNFSNVIIANIGQTISQYQGAGIYANATVYGNTMSNGVTQGNITSSLTGYFLKKDEFTFNATNQIKIDNLSQFSNVFVGNANVSLDYWSNLAIKPISSTVGGISSVETAVPDASITVTRVWSSVKIQGTISSSSDFIVGNIAAASLRNGNVKIGSTWATAYPINVDYVSTTAGTPFDSGDFDNIDYDEDGNPIVSENSIDTIIRSTYLDTALGTRPEDIDIDGGAYFDTYSSHAPEELVPGRTFDTLDMVVYTKVNSNANVIAYRIFDNMVDDVKYLRVADRFSTTLTSPLYFNDANISVANAAALFTPNLSSNEPGVIFIGAERITYWTANTVSNTLGRIRRGTQGTAAANTYNIGTSVIDSSTQQIVPGSAHGNILLTASNTFTVTGTISYNLRVSSNISANVGDMLSQVTSGANATVIGADLITSSLLVVYNSAVDFNHSNVTVGLSGNLQANIGNYITQASSGANLIIVLTNAGGTNALARYNTVTQLIVGSGNLALNGSNLAVYPTSAGTNPVVTSNLIINGNYSNVYPYAREQAGSADIVSIGGNVTVGSGNVLIRANVWYNLGSGIATDGTGFTGAITNAVLFLKDAVANNLVVAGTPDELSTEDTINTMTTEDGQKIIEEDQ